MGPDGGPNAFGNALGDSIAAANGQSSGRYTSDDPLGGLIALNGGWSGVSTNLPQNVGAFSPDMSANTADQLLADLGSGGRSYGGGNLYADASRVLRTGVMTDAGGGGINPGSVESLRQPDGTYRVEINGVADESPAFTDAEVVSMRAENLVRAQALAAQDATAYSSGVMSNEGRAAGTPLAPFPDRWVRPDMVDGSFAAGHWEPLGNDSPNEARRLSNYPSREMQLVGYSNQQASDFSATQWKGFAAEYKAIQGSNFTRDSFYNGLWTKGAQLDIAAGNTNRGIFDEMAGVAGAAGAHADVGLAVGRGIGQGIGNGLGNVMGMAGRGRGVVTPAIGANVPAETGDATARLRDQKTGRFVTDPENPPSPYVFTDAQRRAAWKKIAQDPTSRLTPSQRAEVEARGWRGPQRVNEHGEIETMELSHEPIPLREGGTAVAPKWPPEHAEVDPFRQLKKRPE